MKKFITKIVACAAVCMGLGAGVCSAFDYSSAVNAVIQFNGDGTFTFAPGSNNLNVINGTAAGLLGEITGNYTMGAITTSGGVSTASVSGAGTFVIHDGANDLVANLQWVEIDQVGSLGLLNTLATINMSGITYSGSNPDLLALKNAGSGVNTFTFQFIPAVDLATLASSPNVASFSGSIAFTKPPPCICTLTFNSPARITNCAGDTIPAIVASQDCGSGPTPVQVNPVSTVTAGTCPQIITRTVSATDGCGNAHTFVQTVTVNCQADCTITPSVTVALVGGSNYTASVANAGVGATYNWTVMNGNITAGQGTTKITWAAGTDTSSPITISITISSPAGCLSTCSASVKLNQPPRMGLTGGDTATIGFWQNKNGQGLINGASNSPALANWLASNFPCMYGSLAGKSNSVVAALFITDFGMHGQKTYAQVLAGAFACYFTDSNLGGGSGPGKFGFNNSPGGTGNKTFNVGTLGTVIGLQNNTSYTVLQILQAANANVNCSNGTFSSAVFNALNTIFDGINTNGDIS